MGAVIYTDRQRLWKRVRVASRMGLKTMLTWHRQAPPDSSGLLCVFVSCLISQPSNLFLTSRQR